MSFRPLATNAASRRSFDAFAALHHRPSPSHDLRETPAWFDRTFDPYPAELLPVVLTRLRGAPARLEEATRSSTHARLTTKTDGKWSAQENAGHLLDVEPLWLARVDDYLSYHDKLTAADLTNRWTTDANHNAHSLEQILADFRAARDTLMTRVAALDPSSYAAIPHPRMGSPMTLSDHLHFVAEHDDHHLTRIWSLCLPTTP